jgi:hypothetical protein
MTERELLWLSRQMPGHVINTVCADAERYAGLWADLQIPRECQRAASIVSIELGLIRFGGLKILNRAAT